MILHYPWITATTNFQSQTASSSNLLATCRTDNISEVYMGRERERKGEREKEKELANVYTYMYIYIYISVMYNENTILKHCDLHPWSSEIHHPRLKPRKTNTSSPPPLESTPVFTPETTRSTKPGPLQCARSILRRDLWLSAEWPPFRDCQWKRKLHQKPVHHKRLNSNPIFLVVSTNPFRRICSSNWIMKPQGWKLKKCETTT